MALKAAAVRAENLLATLALGGIMVLPLAEIVSRKFFGTGIPGSGPFAQNLTLWLGLFGAAIAAREGKLLTLATGEFLPKGRIGDVAHVIAGAVGATVATLFALGGVVLVQSDKAAGDIIAIGVPVWIADLALPIGFGLIALRLVWRAVAALDRPRRSPRSASSRAFVDSRVSRRRSRACRSWPWLALMLVAGILGAPIFALLGGIAIFASLVARQPAGRAARQGVRRAHDVDGPRRDSALHARRIPARRRQVVRAAAPRVPRVGRLGARRHRRRGRDALRVLHAVHRRIGRHDSRARRPAAAGARRGRLSRALFDRPAHRVRIARPAVSALAAADALRHRVAEGRRSRICSSAACCPGC